MNVAPTIEQEYPPSLTATGEARGRRGLLVSASWKRIPWPVGAIAVGIAAVVVLLVVTHDIFIPDTSLGWVDAWYYISFGLKLPQRVAQYRYLYQSERIGWTLPAYLFNRIASPLVANFAVKSVFFVGAVAFLFAAVKEITGSVRTATLVSVLAAFHSFFVHSFGTSYVDGPMNTYLLATIYFGTRAFSRPTYGDGVLAGIALGAQVLTHLASLALLPWFGTYWLMVWARTPSRRRALPASIAEVALGLLVVIGAAFALYAHWGAGTMPLQQSVQFVLGHSSNPYVVPATEGWVWHAFWLVVPTAIVAWTLIAMGRSIRVTGRWSAALRLPPVYWLLTFVYGCWVALYFQNQPWLMLPFYSSCLIPFAFLALGRMAVTSVETLPEATYRRMVIALFALGGASYLVARFVPNALALVAVVGCLVAASRLRLHAHTQSSAAFLVLTASAVLCLNCATADYGPVFRSSFGATAMRTIYPPTDSAIERQVTRSERFASAIRIANHLAFRLSGNSGHRYFFWYDRDDGLGMFYRSVTSLLFAWSANDLLDENFHQFDATNRRLLAEYGNHGLRDLVVLSRAADITPPDPRFTLAWSETERVGRTRFFVHYLAFDPSAGAGQQ